MTGPLTAINLALVNIFNFKGRATRSEYWWATLLLTIGGMVASVMDFMMVSSIANGANPTAIYALSPFDFSTTYYILVTFIPFTSLSVRRLHDVGMSGFWWLLQFVPFVGALVLLVFYCMPSSDRATVHGAPKSAPANTKGKPVTVDAHKRAMQGYATLFDKDKPVTPDMQAARKAEIADYYRSRVLKSAPAA